MKLNDKAVAALTVPVGKSELIMFDDDLPGFGVRLRDGGSKTWIVSIERVAIAIPPGEKRRVTIAVADIGSKLQHPLK